MAALGDLVLHFGLDVEEVGSLLVFLFQVQGDPKLYVPTHTHKEN